MSQPLRDEEGQPPPHEDHPEVAWWLKMLVKGIGSASGILAMGTGIWTCLSFKVRCILAGILLCLFGFMVVLFEAPCCCSFLDFVERIGKFGDRRKYWQKAVIYIIFGVLPVVMCFGVSVLPGSAGILGTGVLYGMMSLGRKADREKMRATAAASAASGGNDDMKMTLVNNEQGQKSYGK